MNDTFHSPTSFDVDVSLLRSRVLCVSAEAGVPVSTQWSPKGTLNHMNHQYRYLMIICFRISLPDTNSSVRPFPLF